MSCIWKIFSGKTKSKKPMILTDTKVQNPLYLDEMPINEIELNAWEAALIDNLVSIHYKIEETKIKIANEFQAGRTDRARALIAKNSYLLERKMLFENRLEKVRKNLAALR